jgi:hypothetical protein
MEDLDAIGGEQFQKGLSAAKKKQDQKGPAWTGQPMWAFSNAPTGAPTMDSERQKSAARAQAFLGAYGG